MVNKFNKLLNLIKNSFLDPKSIRPGERDEFMRTEGWNEGMDRILFAARQLDVDELPEHEIFKNPEEEENESLSS
jgi:hypothetical protein